MAEAIWLSSTSSSSSDEWPEPCNSQWDSARSGRYTNPGFREIDASFENVHVISVSAAPLQVSLSVQLNQNERGVKEVMFISTRRDGSISVIGSRPLTFSDLFYRLGGIYEAYMANTSSPVSRSVQERMDTPYKYGKMTEAQYRHFQPTLNDNRVYKEADVTGISPPAPRTVPTTRKKLASVPTTRKKLASTRKKLASVPTTRKKLASVPTTRKKRTVKEPTDSQEHSVSKKIREADMAGLSSSVPKTRKKGAVKERMDAQGHSVSNEIAAKLLSRKKAPEVVDIATGFKGMAAVSKKKAATCMKKSHTLDSGSSAEA